MMKTAVASAILRPMSKHQPRYRRGTEPVVTRAQAIFLVVGIVLASELGVVAYVVPLLLWGAQ